MNELIDMLCGAALTLLVLAPVLYYIVWNILLYAYKVSTEFVTDGDRYVHVSYVHPSTNNFLLLHVLGVLGSVIGLLGMFMIGVSIIIGDGNWKLMILAPYNLGVFCATVISFVLIGVAIMFSMKYGYRLNKFTKKLNEHVKDKEAHK